MEKPVTKIGDIIEIAASSISGQYLHKIPYQPVYMEGPTGIGKTQMVENKLINLIAEKTNTSPKEWEVISIKLSYYTSADILGMPEIDRSGPHPVVTYIKESIMPRKSEGRKGVLFLDEIPLVSNGDVRSALYDLLQNNKLGNDYTLPDNWFVIGAGNRRQDSGTYNGLSPALRDRVMYFEAAFDKKSYVEYMEDIQAHQKVIDYIRDLPASEIHTFSAEAELNLDTDNEIFSTPRSFENSSDKLKLYDRKIIDRKLLHLSLKSIIGEHADKLMETVSEQSGIINQISEWSLNAPDIPAIDILSPTHSSTLNEALQVLERGELSLEKRLNIGGFLVYQGIPDTIIDRISQWFGADGIMFNIRRSEVDSLLLEMGAEIYKSVEEAEVRNNEPDSLPIKREQLIFGK